METPKDLADCTEAVIGAVYLDAGGDLEVTWAVMQPFFDDIIGKLIHLLIKI